MVLFSKGKGCYMDDCVLTLYKKIKITDNIDILKKVKVVYGANLMFSSSSLYDTASYFDERGHKIVVRSIDNPDALLGDDKFLYGYPVTLDSLRELYPMAKTRRALVKMYEENMSEVFCWVYYDKENDSCKVFTSNEEMMSKIDDPDETLFNFFNIITNSDDDEEITFPLSDFKRLVAMIKEKKFDELSDKIIKLNEKVGNSQNLSESFTIDNDEVSEETKGEAKEQDESGEHTFDVDSLKKYISELNALAGLDDVKLEVARLVSYIVGYNKIKDVAEVDKPNLNMVFTGNPGTGKTTVARILGKILYSMGYLKSDKFGEVTAKDFIAEYVGQTGPKSAKLIKKYKNGVIFLDEAYSLTTNGQQFAQEALTEILKEMEKKETVFIFAGYTEEMQDFINSNSGLASRIGKFLEFSDYSEEELFQMFSAKLTKKKFTISPQLQEKVRANIRNARNSINFGNGRYIDKLVEEIIMQHFYNMSLRTDEASVQEYLELNVDDLNEEVGEKLLYNKKVNNRTIGFRSV